ncbi:MAG: hypothetical protein RL226_1331 [Bacteroidota bacterium]
MFMFILLAQDALSQATTRSRHEVHMSGAQNNLTVIPFTPRMMLSDVHAEMCIANQMNSKELKEKLAEGFFHAIRSQSPRFIQTQLFGWDDAWPPALDTLYREIRYESLPIDTALMNPSGSTYISQGQLMVHGASVEKYISARVDTLIIQRMALASAGDFVLVINELDIRNLGVPAQIDPEGVRLFLQVHYTLFSSSGKKLKGGIVRRPFSKSSLLLSDVVRNDLMALAAELFREVGLTKEAE